MSGIYKSGNWYGGGSNSIDVDDTLSSTSENPVQNKVIKNALDNKVDAVSGKGLSTNDYNDTEKAKVAAAVTKAVNDLINYYTKTETYSKTEVDAIITAVKNSRFEIVEELPTTDIETNVIYLVPAPTTRARNRKEEYINIDGTSEGWESLGNTSINLSGYVTTEALNTALADYVSSTDLSTTLSNYIQKSNTVGLVKNDGTIDTNTYLTQHQDISGKQNKTLDTPITVEGTPQTTVEGALSAINNKSGSSGGSGHTIQDSTGTDMTARDNLQFGESLNVTDDSTNDATIVDEYELTNADIEEILSELPSPLSGSNKGCIPCGKVEAFYRETAPDGYLICDGTEYAKADYPKLASILLGLTEHTQYEGSDSDHFKVPDLRGEFLRGIGTNSHENQGSGGIVGQHQDATVVPMLSKYQNSIYYSSSNGGSTINQDSLIGSSNTFVYAARGESGPQSMKEGVTVRPTNTSVLFCIAYKDIFLTTELPVLFDERGTEQPIGKYVRSDGKWKPVYRETITGLNVSTGTTKSWISIVSISDIENIIDVISYYGSNPNIYYPLEYECDNGYIRMLINTNVGVSRTITACTAKYTKTSDEWR